MTSKWSIDDVAKWLEEIGLSQYVTDFKVNKISGQVLPLLKESHLKEMGVTKIGHRLLIMKSVYEIRNGTFSTQEKEKTFENSITTKNVPPPTPPSESAAVVRRQAQKPSNDTSQKVSSKTAPVNTDVSSSASSNSSTTPGRARGARPQFTSEKVKQQRLLDQTVKAQTSEPPQVKAAPKPKASTSKPAQPLRTSVRRSQPPPQEDDPNDDRVACSFCGRKFASDRIAKHEEVCARMSSKKTKVFDSTKMRTNGTDAAAFIKKGIKEPVIKKEINGVPKYKLEHQRLVESMRAARKLQAYEAAKAAGKDVGPPPEMPAYEMPDDDRVACPYCGRKFAEEAAKRHIPVCERSHAGRAPIKGRGKR